MSHAPLPTTAEDNAGQSKKTPAFDSDAIFHFSAERYKKSAATLTPADGIPRNANDDGTWNQREITNWTSGFYAGNLWLLYDYTRDEGLLEAAQKWTAPLEPLKDFVEHHDVGFMMHCSYGNGYRLTQDAHYREILVQAADSLSKRFNPAVGTLSSWGPFEDLATKPFQTIIDNLMNLELLLWVAEETGDQRLRDVAHSHAVTTRRDHFRADNSTCHLVIYDAETGQVRSKRFVQGYADWSMWARGQAWAIYGYTMLYRETQDADFLTTAIEAADTYFKRLPADSVPFWDFDSPRIPEDYRDSSAAAISASGLLELYAYTGDLKHYNGAVNMLNTLATDEYLTRGTANQGIIRHGMGNNNRGQEVDEHLIYGDYYFLEALLKLQRLTDHKPLFTTGTDKRTVS